jgi:hypothetical protein
MEVDLKGFSIDRRKEVMGELLTNKNSSTTVGRVVRAVCPVKHIALNPEGRPTGQMCLRQEADVHPSVLEYCQ